MLTEAINIRIFDTPIGKMLAGATNGSVCLLEFADSISSSFFLQKLKDELGAAPTFEEVDVLMDLEKQVLEYFNSERRTFDLPIRLLGTDFQKIVWMALQNIPYGETRSYGQVSTEIDFVNAVRAVAKANGDNPMLLLIPCHRVISGDGKLTGYSGGLERKSWLLNHERNILSAQQSLF